MAAAASVMAASFPFQFGGGGMSRKRRVEFDDSESAGGTSTSSSSSSSSSSSCCSYPSSKLVSLNKRPKLSSSASHASEEKNLVHVASLGLQYRKRRSPSAVLFTPLEERPADLRLAVESYSGTEPAQKKGKATNHDAERDHEAGFMERSAKRQHTAPPLDINGNHCPSPSRPLSDACKLLRELHQERVLRAHSTASLGDSQVPPSHVASRSRFSSPVAVERRFPAPFFHVAGEGRHPGSWASNHDESSLGAVGSINARAPFRASAPDFSLAASKSFAACCSLSASSSSGTAGCLSGLLLHRRGAQHEDEKALVALGPSGSNDMLVDWTPASSQAAESFSAERSGRFVLPAGSDSVSTADSARDMDMDAAAMVAHSQGFASSSSSFSLSSGASSFPSTLPGPARSLKRAHP